MPLPNSRAQMLCGIAGQQASVDNALIPVGGNAAWLDDTHIVGQGLDNASVVAYDLTARALAPSPLATHPSSHCFGGGGKWGSFYQPANAPSVVDGSYGSFPGAFIFDIGPDGTMALKPVYQSGAGLRLISPDPSNPAGKVTADVPSANPRDLQVLGPGMAVWSENVGVYGAVGRPVAEPVVPTEHFRVATTPDGVEWIVIEAQAGGLVVHRAGATTGYVLVPIGGSAFNVECEVVNGQLVVMWATGPGEAPGQGIKVTVDRTQPEVALTSAPAPTPAPTPGPIATPTAQSLRAHPRKLWIAPYDSLSVQYGDAPIASLLTYSNAILVLPEANNPKAFAANLARAYALGQPMIVGAPADALQYVQPYLGTIVAWYASGADLNSLAASVAVAAALPERPIVAYHDTGGDASAWGSARPAWMTSRVWPSPPAYRRSGEDLSTFAARMQALYSLLANWGVYCGLTPRWDDVNGTQAVSFTTDCMPVYGSLIQQFPICASMPFADRREHGISEDAALLGWAQAFLNANIARPNRYEYWESATADEATQIRNLLGQTVEVTVLSPAKRQFILGTLS